MLFLDRLLTWIHAHADAVAAREHMAFQPRRADDKEREAVAIVAAEGVTAHRVPRS
jgi:hypothetical protein